MDSSKKTCLPINVLPINVKMLISEYSKPLTHPLWKSRKWIPIENIYREIKNKGYKNNVYNRLIINIQNGEHWATLFSYYDIYGLQYTSIKYDIPIQLLDIIVNN